MITVRHSKLPQLNVPVSRSILKKTPYFVLEGVSLVRRHRIECVVCIDVDAVILRPRVDRNSNIAG